MSAPGWVKLYFYYIALPRNTDKDLVLVFNDTNQNIEHMGLLLWYVILDHLYFQVYVVQSGFFTTLK